MTTWLLPGEAVTLTCAISNVTRLSNIPKDLSTLSQMVEISSVYQLLHKQAEPQSPFNHVQDAESLAMIAEAVSPISLIRQTASLTGHS